MINNGPYSSQPLIVSSVSDTERVCFLKWILSFDEFACYSQGRITELWHLSDGLCVNHILSDVYPERAFQAKDMVIQPISSEDCRRNLEACLADIKLFFREIIESGIHPLDMPDLTRIVGLKDEREIVKLIILLLCCVVHSHKKEFYVKRILTFDTTEKQLLMVNIERILYVDEDDHAMATELHSLYVNWLGQLESLNKQNRQLGEMVEKMNRDKLDMRSSYENLSQQYERVVEELEKAKATTSLQNIGKLEMQKKEQRLLEEM